MVDLNIPLWTIIYEKLFGGFDDIGDEDSEEEEDDEDEVENKTKQGYSKDDGFVVDDDEDEDEDDDDDDEDDDIEDDNDDEEEFDDGDDDDEEPVKARVQPKRAVKKNKKLENVFIAMHNVEEDAYLNCDSELSEEEYI